MRPVPPDPTIKRTDRAFHLLGLVRGHWSKAEDEALDFTEVELEPANLGIAIVTPITELLPVFEREAFVAHKKEMDKRLISSDAPAEDYADGSDETDDPQTREQFRRDLAKATGRIDETRREKK